MNFSFEFANGLLNQADQGARKDGRGNEPVGSCAMCDAQSTGLRALEGKNRWKVAGQNKIL